MARLTSILVFLIAFGISVPSQSSPEVAKEPLQSSVKIPSASQWDMRSVLNGHTYRIFVSTPSSSPPPGGFPVIYVLDGNAAFPVAALLARNTESRSAVTGIVPPVVVGIGYPNDEDYDVSARKRDYTISEKKADSSADEGAADEFLDVLEKEIKPAITSAYPINANRQAIFGHSFGGLLVLHALFTRTKSFTTYLASSPSIWWKERILLNELPAFKLAMSDQPAPYIQLSVGSLEDQVRPPSLAGGTQTSVNKRAMVTEAHNLASVLQTFPALKNRFHYYELVDEDHGSSWLPAMSRGFRLFLSNQ